MQGTLARAREENNSSLIWGLVGSPRQGLFLHWISATVLLPVPDTDLPWLPCRAGLLGEGGGGVAVAGVPGAARPPVEQSEAAAQCPRPAMWKPCV